MNDQELLTYAAKAAGIEYAHVTSAGLYLGGSEDNFWSPLNSDADAFQLMVKLNIAVEPCKEKTMAFYGDFGVYGKATCTHATDKESATRRAIVMAAAEIGKGM